MAYQEPAPPQMLKSYKQRHATLRNDRDLNLQLWIDIRNFLAPRTARFPGEQVNQLLREDLNIINTSPRYAVRTLPAGMQSGVTSPMRPWFRLGTPDPEMMQFKPVKLWLYEVETLMREVFLRSNVYDRLKSNYHILGTYGTSCLFVEESPNEIIRAYDYPMGSFCLSQNDEGRTDTMYRDIEYTTRQIVEKFKEKAPENVRAMYDRGNYEQKYPLVHITEPNNQFRPDSALSKFKRFASVWIDPACDYEGDDKGVLRYSGYDDDPKMAPRWDVLGENVWGTGCGDYAIGDGKQLQLMEKRKLQGIDKNVNPTMIADASMRNQRVSNLPGDTTYVNGLVTGNQGYRPAYVVNPYINELREESAAVSNRIDEAFYKNLFLMVTEIADQPNITATQINTMREEKLLMLGPVLERLNNELLNPLIDRTFSIMLKRGMLPPPPEEIQGQALRVEYISVLAQAQKAMGIGNIERITNFIGGLASAQGAAGQAPTAIHKLNINATIDAYAEGIAVPPNLIRTDEEAGEIIDAENQKQAAAQMSATMPAMAKAAKDISDIDMSKDSPVTRAADQASDPNNPITRALQTVNAQP